MASHFAIGSLRMGRLCSTPLAKMARTTEEIQRRPLRRSQNPFPGKRAAIWFGRSPRINRWSVERKKRESVVTLLTLSTLLRSTRSNAPNAPRSKKRPSRAGVWQRERVVGAGRKFLSVLFLALIYYDVMAAAIAPHPKQCAFVIIILAQFASLFGSLHRFAIDLLDHVPGAKAGLCRSRIRLHISDHHAVYIAGQVELLPSAPVQIANRYAAQRARVLRAVAIFVFGQVLGAG